MYQIYCGNRVIFENGVEDLPLKSADLELELGKTGSLEFTIYPTHPNYDAVVPMAMVSVRRNYETIYSGRVLKIKYGFYNEKQVSCEGELAFLLDAMIEPHYYSDGFAAYFRHTLDKHNSMVEPEKQFLPGAVTVGDFYPFTVEEPIEYRTTFDTLNARMVEPSGGYLSVRYENGNRYLDLLSSYADASNVSGQAIEVGKNLLDISREFDGAKVFTAIIPLGAKLKDTDDRVNIKAVNDGVPYLVNAAAVAQYGGKIYRQVIFDNITSAQTLKAEAEDYLAKNYAGESSIEITAADLSGVDPTIDFFRVGQWVKVSNKHHFGYETQIFLIKKLTINLLSPAETKIVIGAVKKGLSEEVAGISNSVDSIEVPEAVQPYVMESGTTGIWTWKKFSDNTCEFFGKVPITSADVTTGFGAWFRGSNLYEANTYEYPFEMTEAPALEMTFQTRNGMGAMLWVYSMDADTAQQYLPQSYLIRPSTATGIFGNINIIGKGKLKQ